MKKSYSFTKALTLTVSEKETTFEKVQVLNSSSLADYARKLFSDDIQIFESFFILLLNRQNQIIAHAKISQGGTTGTVVDVKIIAKYCIDTLASSCIMVHNHPSGNLKASEEDKNITRKVVKALDLFDTKVLDHVIITADSYFSFADEGLIQTI